MSLTRPKVIKDGSTDDMVKGAVRRELHPEGGPPPKQDVSGGLWTLAEKMPVVGGDVKTARTAIGTIDDFSRRPRCPSWARSSPH